MVLDTEASRQPIIEFLKDNHVGVIATADARGVPHASTVYVVHDSVLNFYIVTKKDTKKAQNISENPFASIAVYDASKQTALHVDGDVSVVENEEEGGRIFSEIQSIARRTSISGTPPITQLFAGGYVTYRLTPRSIGMTAYGQDKVQKQDVPTSLL